MATTLLIDGSILEGGGQLLRNSVALSTLFQRPITIHNIRASRKPPGLKNQHAAGLRLVAELCNADMQGCDVGSSTIDFKPGPIQMSRHYTADTQTAGSTTLLMQVSLPCLLFGDSSSAPTELELKGGTNAIQAPQIDYTLQVFLPFLQRWLGLKPTVRVPKRGFYPRGGGEVVVSVPQVSGPLPAVNLTDRGDVTSISGRAYVAGLPKSVAESMSGAATKALVDAGYKARMIDIVSVREKPADAVGSGSGIMLWAETERKCVFGGSAVGRKGKDPAKVAKEAIDELMRNLEHGGCVDEYMQDQMIVFLALAKGRSIVRTGPLTLHTSTAIWVAEQLTDARFTVTEDKHGATIQCDGIGFTAAATPS